MPHTILGFFNRAYREQIAEAHRDDGFIITVDLFACPVIASARDFVELGDEGFKQVGHDGWATPWRFLVRGKGEE